MLMASLPVKAMYVCDYFVFLFYNGAHILDLIFQVPAPIDIAEVRAMTQRHAAAYL